MIHNEYLFDVYTTEAFDKWFSKLKDRKLKARVIARLDRLAYGSFGDTKQLSSEVSEIRFMFGGGIRIYFTRHNEKIVLLLAGGNKATQRRDIVIAEKLAREYYDEVDSI